MTDAPTVGDNSGMTKEKRDDLKKAVERIENLKEQQAALAGDVKDIFTVLKADGWDTKIVRKVLAIRKRDKKEVEDEKAMIDLYLDSLEFMQ
jgi:uncharacterized protein (UPF0335 family)